MAVGVMLVDDDPDMLALMRAVIEAANEGLYVSGAAASGEEALQCVVEVDPDVVVLDQAMPGLTGVQVAERLRERRPDQSMMLFTAYLTTELAQQAASAGIARCHGKTDVMRLPDLLRDLTKS